MSARRRSWAWPAGIGLWAVVLLGLALRLARLGLQPLWWDEGWSLYFATLPAGRMFELTAVDIHPPLYYLLLHGWISAFGPTPLSVRLLSVLIGAAAVPVAYLAGRRLLGSRGGLLAAFLLAVSPFHVFYSQEVRMYGLVTLLGLLALYFALDWRAGPPGRWAWAGYVPAAAAALYTQYYAAFLLLALNVVIVVHAVRTRAAARRLASWLAAQAAVVLLYLPWLVYAGGKLLTYVQNKVVADKDVPLCPLTYLARHLAALDWGHAEGALAAWWWVGLVPLAALAGVGLYVLVTRGAGKPDRSRLPAETSQVEVVSPGPWAVGAITCAVLVACGYLVNVLFPFNPPRAERLLLVALPAYLLLVVAAVLAIAHRHRLLAAGLLAVYVLGGAVSLAFFYTVPRYPDDDYRPLAARLQAVARPGDVIVCVHPWQVGYFHAYLPDGGARPTLYLTPRDVLPRERQYWADDPDEMVRSLTALLARYPRLWLPAHEAMGRVLEGQIEHYLVAHAYPALAEWYGENTLLYLFAGGEPMPRVAPARFGTWLSLDHAAVGAVASAGEDVLPVTLDWSVAGPRPADAGEYRVGLRLADAAGRVWAQRDSLPLGGLGSFADWPAADSQPDRHGLLVPAGTPPGTYQVTARVYRPRDFDVLPATFEGGSGGEVALGRVTIVRPARTLSPAALAYDHALRADAGPLRLWGYTRPGGTTFKNGESVDVDLFWQARAAPGEDYMPRLRLVDGAGRVQAELTEKPVAGAYPTAWWQAGELVRDPHSLPIPAAVPAGAYRLVLSLVRAADGAEVKMDGKTGLDLGDVTVQSRDHQLTPPAPQHPQAALLGGGIELVGYDLAEAVRTPGSPLRVVLYWHAQRTPDRGYRVFVHMLDAAGEIVAQHDGVPGGGDAPTLGWLPGEYVADPHDLALPPDLPAGAYRLEIGLYDPLTQQRPAAPTLLDTPVHVDPGGCLCP